MKILITGATGFIGSHLTRTLLQAGHEVTVCVRNPAAAAQRWPGITAIPGNFQTDHRSADWAPRVTGVDVVINAVGIIREQGKNRFDAIHTLAPIALFKACAAAQVKKIIQISALGADDSAFSHYHLSKKAADDLLTTLQPDWLILQPSIVYGPGAKSMGLFKALACLPVIPLIEQGDQPIQPIHISDLIRAVMACIRPTGPRNRRIVLVGPAPVTMKTLYEQLGAWLGRGRRRFVSLPYRMALRLARWGGFMGATPLTPEAVTMLQRGNTGDVGEYQAAFNHTPISLADALAETPAQTADRWYAGLYFLPPLIRFSIAFVWLFTGVISAWVIPLEYSYALLERAHISGMLAPIMLYGAAATDILLGIAVLARYRVSLLGYVQILLILIYSAIITATQPEQWLHPFGPVSKNVPLITTILVMMILEKNHD
ncbi:NAD(P)H-binding protein [Sedimenticola hydrogenitrophicus]|uniref:NAD(P)H-binding protein n=1 Tax=Sedimenticola hydrogenitrophicus TaxID=2967975 RepID=UPI0021A900BA|nr:NAD(P)H-binding protein [Sedimenticola hydrogenitrophicus]